MHGGAVLVGQNVGQSDRGIGVIEGAIPLFLGVMGDSHHLWYLFDCSWSSPSLLASSKVSFYYLQSAISFGDFHELFFIFPLYSSA